MDSYPVTTYTCEGAKVICPEGYVNDAAGRKLAQACVDLMRGGEKALIIDFSQAKDVNSQGIASLFSAIEVARQLGATVALAGANPGLRRSLEILGITEYCQVHATAAEAARAVHAHS